ncbi:MAG: DUF262 domain-containing protein [Rhodobacteraceae bacterium]|nr:DUF262 domain-containing protein [Paracoccaceae bacterium]
MPNGSNLRIEASHKAIADVFSDKYAFSIPAYQRPYAWETPHVEDLLADLREAMTSSDEFYFLGSIVLVKQPDKPEADVIDGQQRLTTLAILFSVIRDLTEEEADRLSRDEFVKQRANKDRGLQEAMRLRLREKDQNFFKKHIQDTGSTENLPPKGGLSGAQARLVENAATIRGYLKKMDEGERDELMALLAQKCYLVVVEVPNQIAAHRIFTVLNTRGMDLAATDILKSALLKRAGPAREKTLSQRWENVEGALGRDTFNDLFTHIRMIFQRTKPDSALETGFPEHVAIFDKEPSGFMDSILEPYADAFTLSQDNSALRERFDDQTASLICSLNRLDNKDWLPPLLLCLKQWKDNRRNQEGVKEFVFNLERRAYHLLMVRAHVNTRIKCYAKLINYLDPPNANAKAPEALHLTEEECAELFKALDGNIYLANRVVKPILLKLEQSSADRSAIYNYPTLSVEHVCPQSLPEDSEWSNWYDGPNVHKDWLHTLGNLVLLNRRKNAAAGNLDFTKKKDEYFKLDDTSPFILTNQLRNYETWTPADVNKRRKELLTRLAQAWDIEDNFNAWWEEQGKNSRSGISGSR